MGNKLKINDQVIVITGKNKGQIGTIQKIEEHVKLGRRAVVSGVNAKRKAVRPRPDRPEQEGGIQTIHAPVQISNLAIFNPTSGKKDRVGFKIEDGKKTRVYKSSGEAIVVV